MTASHSFSISVCLAGLMCAGCEDAQPGSISGGSMEQISISSSAAIDKKGEVGLNIRLEAIQRSRPEVSSAVRNPFRIGDSLSETLAEQGRTTGPVTIETAQGLSRVFPVSAQAHLRMIGLVEASEAAGKIVVLTDGVLVFHGREGDLVEGQYRILNVDETSVEIESVHDSKRQVLRLAGS